MPIPLTIAVYEKGANGVPQTTGRADNLRGRIDSYEQTITDRYGFEAMSCGWSATLAEALDWLRPEQLGRACVVSGPRSSRVWEGLLTEVEVQLGRLTLRLSLKDMANRLIVRYNQSSGEHGSTTVYENAASQYLFGKKDRVLNLAGTTSTGAANRAQTALNLIAFPRSKEASESGTSSGGGISVQLKFEGWASVLSWLLTDNTSESVVNNKTQISSLISSYCAINNFLSTDSSAMRATLPSDTEFIEEDTTYWEKIERLLAQGDSTNEPLAYGIYENRKFVIEVSAAAAPGTIHYYEHSRTGEITDPYGNVVMPWDVRPNRMAQVLDVLDIQPPNGAIDGATRKHVSRVVLRISGDSVTVSLEPTEDESLDKILASPAGAGPAGTSERQAAVERSITAVARPRFEPADNPLRYSAGAWQAPAGGTGKKNPSGVVLDIPTSGGLDLGGGTIDTGGGSISTGGGTIDTGGGSISTGGGTIDTGGGSISTGGGSVSNSGGGAVDLGTGAGIGGAGASGVTTTGAGGTPGRLAQFDTATALEDSTLVKSGAGVLTLNAGSSMTVDLDGSTGQVLQKTSGGWAAATLAASAVSAAPDNATYIVQTASAGLSAEQALGSLATGILKNTTTTGVLSIATGSDLPSHNHAAGDITSGTMATARLGSGTASGSNFLRGDSVWATPTFSQLSGVAPDNAKYIVQQATGDLSAEQALGALATGILKNTTTTGVLSIATGSDLPDHASNHENGGGDELALDASQITTGTMAAARLGSGPSSSTFLRGDSVWATPTFSQLSGVAPDNAKYIVQQATGDLSAEQALGALATGLLKNTTSTGVLSIATGSDLPSHNHAAGDITSGTMATARLGSGTASGSNFLRGDSVWAQPTFSQLSGVAPDNAKYIVQQATGDLSAEQALGALATGLLKNTTSTGVLSIATGSDLPTHASRHENGGADEISIDTSQVTSGTMATARLGSGTASSSTFLRGDSTWVASPDGSGVAGKLAYWLDSNTLQEATGAAYDVGADRVTVSAITCNSLRCDTNGTFDRVNINSSTAPTHSLQLTSTDSAAKSATNTWTVTSDLRTKTILGAYEKGLRALLDLPLPYMFEHNGKFETQAGIRAVGFIAQEIEQVEPAWIERVMKKEHPSDPDGSEQEIMLLNANSHIYILHMAIREIAAHLGLTGKE